VETGLVEEDSKVDSDDEISVDSEEPTLDDSEEASLEDSEETTVEDSVETSEYDSDEILDSVANSLDEDSLEMLLDSSDELVISVDAPIEESVEDGSELIVVISVVYSDVVDSDTSDDIEELPSPTPKLLTSPPPTAGVLSEVVDSSVKSTALLELASLELDVSVDDCSDVGVELSDDVSVDSVPSLEEVDGSEAPLVSESRDDASDDAEVLVSDRMDVSTDVTVELPSELCSVEIPNDDALTSVEESSEELSLDDASVLTESVDGEEDDSTELDSEVISELPKDDSVVWGESPLPSNVGDAVPLSSVKSDEPNDTKSEVSLTSKVDGLSLSIDSELKLVASLPAVNKVASPRLGDDPDPSSRSVENTSTPSLLQTHLRNLHSLHRNPRNHHSPLCAQEQQ